MYTVTAKKTGLNICILETFRYRYFALRAAKFALKRGFEVTIVRSNHE